MRFIGFRWNGVFLAHRENSEPHLMINKVGRWDLTIFIMQDKKC